MSCRTSRCPIPLYHTILCRTLITSPCAILPYHTIPYRVVPCLHHPILSRYTIPYRALPTSPCLQYIIPYRTVPCHTLPTSSCPIPPHNIIPSPSTPYSILPYRILSYQTPPYLILPYPSPSPLTQPDSTLLTGDALCICIRQNLLVGVTGTKRQFGTSNDFSGVQQHQRPKICGCWAASGKHSLLRRSPIACSLQTSSLTRTCSRRWRS